MDHVTELPGAPLLRHWRHRLSRELNRLEHELLEGYLRINEKGADYEVSSDAQCVALLALTELRDRLGLKHPSDIHYLEANILCPHCLAPAARERDPEGSAPEPDCDELILPNPADCAGCEDLAPQGA